MSIKHNRKEVNPISPNTENAFKNQTREKNLTMVLTDASSSGIMSSIALLTALWYCKRKAND